MANVIKIKRSGVTTVAPTSLEYGELAINYADGLLFYKDSNNQIISFDLSGALNVSDVSAAVDDLEVSIAMQTF